MLSAVRTIAAAIELAAAKLLAWRPKDLEWLEAGIGAKLIDPRRVDGLLDETNAVAAELELARTRLKRLDAAE